jgi:hypothetical protein
MLYNLSLLRALLNKPQIPVIKVLGSNIIAKGEYYSGNLCQLKIFRYKSYSSISV